MHRNWLYASLALLLSRATADVTTKVVQITRTTTVHVTATDYDGACDNFVGACVVYGTANSAPYTTTVYRYAPTSTPTPPAPTTVITSTQVVVATTTASDEGACASFSGACVVYATDGNAASTVYDTSGYATQKPGNGQGFIAAGPKGEAGSDGAIGSGAGSIRWTTIAVLGAAVVCAVFMM
jgi:hypothetical protein